MRRTLIVALGLAGLMGGLAACGDEDPTGVGSTLLGPGVTTFEVVLEADQFLLSDTTYPGFATFRDLGSRLVANGFAGELDAHTLARINRPFTVTYVREEGGTSQADSLLSIRGGRFTLIVDTIATTDGPIAVEVAPITESWETGSVTWTLRTDTADVSEPWTTPGGTTGPVAGSGVWVEGDTLFIPVDSAAAAVWHDTANARLGALIRTTTEGARLRLRSVSFSFDVVPRARPDTLLEAGSVTQTAYIVSPEEPSAAADGELRVGGLPFWRSLLHFRPLDDIVVNACTGTIGTGDPACDVPLGDATVSLAQVLLTPLVVGGRRVESPLRIDAREVLLAEGVPVSRAPLAPLYGSVTVNPEVPVELFGPPGPGDQTAGVRVTNFVRDLIAGVEEDDEDDPPPSEWLALLSTAETGASLPTLGYMSFSSMEGTSPPRLRLIVTMGNPELFE